MRRPRANSVAERLVLLALYLAAAFAATTLHPGAVSDEAIVREQICHQLIANTTEGRQALVGSLWWAPLPTLLRLPLVGALPETASLGLASMIISGLFGYLVLLLLGHILARWELTSGRVLILGGVLLYPFFLPACVDGSSTTTVLFLALAIVRGFIGWVSRRSLRSLVGIGAGTALLLVTSATTAPWLLCVFVCLLVEQIGAKESGRHKEAVMVITLTPILYVVGLWMLLNWLIMGDGLYMFRALAIRTEAPGFDALRTFDRQAVFLAPTVLAVLLTALAIGRRDSTAFYIACLGLAPLGAALGLSLAGYPWEPGAILGMALPIAVAGYGYLVRWAAGHRAGLRNALALAPVALAAAAFVAALAPTPTASPPAEAVADAQVIRQARDHVQARGGAPRVFVTGYRGLSALRQEDMDIFLPSLDFDFARATRDYHGQALYLLIHRPAGPDAVDSIHWRYGNIYAEGFRTALHDRDWGDWRLFQIVQAPTTQWAMAE